MKPAFSTGSSCPSRTFSAGRSTARKPANRSSKPSRNIPSSLKNTGRYKRQPAPVQLLSERKLDRKSVKARLEKQPGLLNQELGAVEVEKEIGGLNVDGLVDCSGCIASR